MGFATQKLDPSIETVRLVVVIVVVVIVVVVVAAVAVVAVAVAVADAPFSRFRLKLFLLVVAPSFYKLGPPKKVTVVWACTNNKPEVEMNNADSRSSQIFRRIGRKKSRMTFFEGLMPK